MKYVFFKIKPIPYSLPNAKSYDHQLQRRRGKKNYNATSSLVLFCSKTIFAYFDKTLQPTTYNDFVVVVS
jgi:hypothetical protein